MPADTAMAAELEKCETKIAHLQAQRPAAATDKELTAIEAKISREVTTVEKLAEGAETNALAALRSEYRFLCRATAKAAIARAMLKKKRDEHAARYYQAHAEFLAADAIASALEHQVRIGFALRLAPEVRTALASDLQAARHDAGLKQPA